MRIGFIGSSLNLLSGSGKPTFQLMNNLDKRGIKTGMLSDNLSDSVSSIQSTLLQKYGMEHLSVERANKKIPNGLLKGDKEIISVIKEFTKDFDLLVCGDFFLPWLLERNELKREVPIIFLAANNLDFKVKFLIDSGLAAMSNLFKPAYFSKLLLPNFLMKNFLSHFNHIIATSRFVMENFKKFNLAIPISYLPVGVDINSKFLPFNSEKEVFLYFGWGSGIRGIQDVLQAFESYRNLNHKGRLIVYLQGQHGLEEKFYLKRIKKSNFSRFIETGFFNERIHEIILSSKAVILPFRVPFGYSQPPITILESMALGRVVISTKVGCIPELIRNGQDGFLTNPARPDEILNVLINLDESLVNYIGKNAFNKMRNIYSWEVIVNQYIKKFGEILNETK